jgi:hypothetical protein
MSAACWRDDSWDGLKAFLRIALTLLLPIPTIPRTLEDSLG